MPFLRTASPERAVTSRCLAPGVRASTRSPTPTTSRAVLDAFAGGPAVLRLPPAADLVPVVQAAASLGDPLVLCARRGPGCPRIADRLDRAGVPTALHPDDWARAAAGGFGRGRAPGPSAWAPVPDLAAIVVLDEHDEVHQEERSPTWHARDVALERARRARASRACSPRRCRRWRRGEVARLVTVDRAAERSGLAPGGGGRPPSRGPTGRNALFSPTLADVVRCGRTGGVRAQPEGPGRPARLRQLRRAGPLRTVRRGVHRARDDELVCRRCGTTRPVVCASCGSTNLKTIRMGVSRVRDDLEALRRRSGAWRSPAETTDAGRRRPAATSGPRRCCTGSTSADVVAFLDLDQELFAPRYRAAEQALGAASCRAARLVGGRPTVAGGCCSRPAPRSTRWSGPRCDGDPHAGRRGRTGPAAPARVPALRAPWPRSATRPARRSSTRSGARRQPDVQVLGPVDGRWRVRAPDHDVLCDALAATDRPPGRLRLAVDPLRV